MKNSNEQHKTPHAPGAGSDKHHPETPNDANERFKENQKKDNIQDNPENQNTG